MRLAAVHSCVVTVSCSPAAARQGLGKLITDFDTSVYAEILKRYNLIMIEKDRDCGNSQKGDELEVVARIERACYVSRRWVL